MTNVVPFTIQPAPDPSGTSRPDDESAVYTVADVARLLRVSLGSAYTLVRTGEVPARKVGNLWVISKRRFHAWLDDAPDPTGESEAR